MKKLLLLLTLSFGIALAQEPILIFGDLTVDHHATPGIGFALPVSSETSIPFEYGHGLESKTVTVGLSQTLFHIGESNGVSTTFDYGIARFHNYSKFLSEYSIGYDREISKKWSISPYFKISRVDHTHTFSGGLYLNYKWFRK